MNRRWVAGRALSATLADPGTWPLALATFLLRGGLLVLAVPIVVLPTPVGLANVFAPMLTALAFGSISTEVYVVAGIATVGLVVWLVVGGWVAAALEAEGIRIVGADARLTQSGPAGLERPRAASRILAARLTAMIPLGIALAVGSVRVVLVTYRELTDPVDVATPLGIRVLRESPEVVVAVLVTWMVGEILGGIASRRIVLAGDGVLAALRYGVVTSVRRPGANLAWFGLPAILLLTLVISVVAAVGSAWSAVGGVIGSSSDLAATLAGVGQLVVVWLVGLALIALASAWRAAIWTVGEVEREGTFGGSPDRRPGDWQTDRTSATL